MALMLKNLKTAAFGNSTSTLSVSIDDHPRWRQHQRQRDALAATLSEATDDVSRLQRERAQAEHDARESAVGQLLGDDLATVTPDAGARIVHFGLGF